MVRACCLGSMRCAALKSPKGLFAGTQSSCGPAHTAGPISREAYDVRPRKVRRAFLRDAIEVRPHKLRKACCQGSIRCAPPESPNDLFSNKFERHFAANTPIAAQTPICSPKANSLPNASLQPKRQFAAQTPICSPDANSQPIASLQHFCSPNAFQLPKRMYPRGAALQTPQGLLSGKHAMRGPVKSEGPVGRDTIELRPRKNRRACCPGSIRRAPRKSPKGLFAGTQSNCGPANTAWPVSREAYDVRPRKVRRACSQGRNRGVAKQTPQGLLSGKYTMCGAGKYE